MNMRNQWPVLPIAAGLASGLLTGCGSQTTGSGGDGSAVVIGMSDDYGRLQDIVAEQVPVLPIWQAKQYAVVQENVYGLENCLDASTVFRFRELEKG
ncbi:hypothetical protein AB0L47_30335 [Streptomyces bobili]|uniref:hypothetical protein n=1 Tax=Streptomyces bobili TaxID=67280 RepID=UPI003434FC08